MASDAQIGKFVLIVAIIVFVYYFFWVSIFPFMLINEGNILHALFPPLEYAFIVPAIFGVIFLGGIVIFTLYHMWDFYRTKRIFCAPLTLSQIPSTEVAAAAAAAQQKID